MANDATTNSPKKKKQKIKRERVKSLLLLLNAHEH